MDRSTARFIRRENVRHYRQLLETITDEAERQRILRLLDEEQKKQQAAGVPVEEE
jgi:rubrerythrin